MKLEQTEWSRTWREKVNDGIRRVLVVGDSVMDGCKTYIGEYLRNKAAITAYTTSKAVNNPFYIRELEVLFCQEPSYSAVYFNNGLHPGGQDPYEYGRNMEHTLRFLINRYPGIPVIVGLSTPIAQAADDGLVYGEANRLVIEYNEEARKTAAVLGLTVFDAYSFMDCHPEWRSEIRTDMYHYNENGYRAVSKAIADELNGAINGKSI